MFGNDPWGDGLASWLWKRSVQHVRRVVAGLDDAIEELPEGSPWIWAFQRSADVIELACGPEEEEETRAVGGVRRGHLRLVGAD